MAAILKRRRAGKHASARPAGRGLAGPVQRNGTVSQWGNSLGIRIPREAAERLRLVAGAEVTMEFGDDAITIRPTRARGKWKLADLLKGVTPAKVGGELDWGRPVGKERL